MEPQRATMTELGLMGLVPFAAAAAGVWLSPWILPAGAAFDLTAATLIYAAVVGGFIVGLGAGGALSRTALTTARLRAGMIAALVLWIVAWPPGALFIHLPDAARFAIVIIAFVYLYIRDRQAVAAGELPQWYGALRARLTFWSCLFLAAIVARLMV